MIKDRAFEECKSLKKVTFQERIWLQRLSNNCFDRTNLEEIVIPRSVQEIQKSTFSGCANLREVIFEKGSALERLEERVFIGCCNLRNISLPRGLESIGTECFAGSGLEEITIPSGVKTL